MSGKVFIIGIGSTALGRHPAKSVKDLTREAVDLALADAGCMLTDVEAAWFSNTRQGIMENQNTIRGQCALRAMGFETIPIVNVENACASSSTGLNQAFRADQGRALRGRARGWRREDVLPRPEGPDV